jgi:hypothetical protein
MTILAQNQDGQYMPAYARYASNIVAIQVTNIWRPPSENTQADAWRRFGNGVMFRLFTNLVDEFGGDAKRKLLRRKSRP